MAEISGVLLIDKPCGMTSHDVVNRVRRLYNTKRVGHTGTLDPMATGLLVVLVGRAAKAAEYLSADSKSYVAGIRLGITTDTEDTTGNILTESDNIPTESEVMSALDGFRGDIKQIPPMYSALKVNGQKLVDLARKNVTVEREARDITVSRLDCTRVSDTEYTLTVDCSKGTYIRTLCADIGVALGCGAAMSSLRRERAGNYTIEAAHTLDELDKMELCEREELLIPVETLFEDLETVQLPQFYERLARNGAEIYQKKIKTSLDVGTRVRMYGEKGFFALGEVMDYPDGSAVKSIKIFDL